jgi:hypothetical protein
VRRLGFILACGAVLGVATNATPALAGKLGAAAHVRTVEVKAAQGHVAAAVAAVHRAGGRVTVRRGQLMQAQVPPRRLAAVRRATAVAGVGPAYTGHADNIISQGVYRTGADALQVAGITGKGIRVAILDLGFGANWQRREGTELPPASQIDAVVSFDKTTGQPGVAGLSSSDKPTGHGESVAEVVHDMAPGARLTLVNYHTELEFVQAVDWLINGPNGKPRVDIVVHSNSFLDGPFDGTGMTAQEVDKARAAGILWVNSVGNYAHRHWEGAAIGDRDGDGYADLGAPHENGVHFVKKEGDGVGVTLYWSHCTVGSAPVPATSVGYELQVTDANDVHPLVLARGVRDATRPLESTGFIPAADGTYAVRARMLTPGAVCTIEIFGGGLDLGTEATVPSSVPTPGDAAGSLSVGATNWVDDSLADYSSQGPTQDGRMKPDMVAPASTLVSPGIAMVGTSASAPHVGGAAALLMQEARQAGQPWDAGTITKELESQALDMGPPGPDNAYGYGRLRLDLTPPAIVATTPAANAIVHGTIRLGLFAADAGTLDWSSVSIDGQPAIQAPGDLGQPFSTRILADGAHTALFTVRDMAGNSTQLAVPFVVDNTPPLISRSFAARTVAGGPLDVTVEDAGPGDGQVRIRIVDSTGLVLRSSVIPLHTVNGTATLRIPVPPGARGRLRIRVDAVDGAGNLAVPLGATLQAAPRPPP